MNTYIAICIGFLLGLMVVCLIPRYSNDLQSQVNTLIRQASRWSTAAEQDENNLIAVLHANYGAGYLWALKDIATEAQIESIGQIDLKRFEKEIVSIQDKATDEMVRLCPSFGPPRSYLTNLAKR
tara:strand:- start:483 stop:857 length:375 start_codon:yes stop_codon:yes gene_type:complete